MDILLVEDDFDVARNICEYFEAEGHDVEWAPDGLIGLECATRQRRDVIILDIALPRLSGTDLCRRLRELGFMNVPILMLTARSDLSDKLEAFKFGADDYVVKPFALEELESRILALVRRTAGTEAGPLLRVADLEFVRSELKGFDADRDLAGGHWQFRGMQALCIFGRRFF